MTDTNDLFIAQHEQQTAHLDAIVSEVEEAERKSCASSHFTRGTLESFPLHPPHKVVERVSASGYTLCLRFHLLVSLCPISQSQKVSFSSWTVFIRKPLLRHMIVHTRNIFTSQVTFSLILSSGVCQLFQLICSHLTSSSRSK